MGKLIKKKLAGIEVMGFSLAGEETVVAVPEYNVCFDVGRAPREIISIDNICLTHGHMDHAAGLAYYFSHRGFLGNSPGRVIVHHSLAGPIQALLDVWAEIEGHISAGIIHPANHLEDVPIRRGLIVRPFTVNHTGAALGFTLVELRRKLKADYHGMTGPELVALKKQGIDIEDSAEHPVVTFTGDTAVGSFLKLDFVRETQVLIIECTFFDPEHRSRARLGKHIHVDDLPKVLEAVPNAQVMLTHLSRRTEMRLAKRILRETVKSSDLDRIVFLMDRPPRPARRRGADPTAQPDVPPDRLERANAKPE